MDEYLKNKIKDTPLENHEIWTKYKNKTIHIDTVLVAPSGAGGHFLAQFIFPDVMSSVKDPQVGEWMSEPRHANNVFFTVDIDFEIFLNNTYVYTSRIHQKDFIELDYLIELVSYVELALSNRKSLFKLNEKEPIKFNMFMSHVYPYVLSHIYNLQIDKLIFVHPYNLNNYTAALDIIKVKFGMIPLERVFLLIDHFLKHNDLFALKNAIKKVKNGSMALEGLYSFTKEVVNSPILNKYSHWNFDFLMRFNNRSLETYIKYCKHEFIDGIEYSTRELTMAKYLNNYFKELCNNFYIVDYHDLFFKLKTDIFDKKSYVKQTDFKKIIKYNSVNINLIKNCKKIIPKSLYETVLDLENVNNKLWTNT